MQEYNSEDISEIVKALINVQRQLQPATKDANTPFTKSKYATLNSVMDISGWSRNSPMRSLDNGNRALRWFLCPRPIPRD